MATQLPISTISYNSEAFLKEKLESLYNSHVIQSYMYILHKGEDGDKDHIHLRVEPNKRLDPMELADTFREYVLGSEKPLGVRPFRQSKEEDWILYAVHDEEYLRLKYGDNPEKGEKIPYKWQDIKADEYFDVEVAFIRAKSSMKHSSVNLATRVQNGENPMQMILQGESPYAVYTLVKALTATDYTSLAEKYNELHNRYNALCNDFQFLVDILSSWGFTLCYGDSGRPYLQSENGIVIDGSEM